jgi:hypothetical protein
MRQDVLIAEALLPSLASSPNQSISADIMAAITQRHRQLGAHEVGHTLGTYGTTQIIQVKGYLA